MSKTEIVLKNNYERCYMEQGPKTYGRLHMFKSIETVLKYIYGFVYETKLGVQSICFDENESTIYAKILLFRPGILIGKMGMSVEKFEEILSEIFDKSTKINIEEAKKKLYGLVINYISFCHKHIFVLLIH